MRAWAAFVALLTLVALAPATPSASASSSASSTSPCRDLSFETLPFTVCTFDVSATDLRLFLRDDKGKVLGQFSAVTRSLAAGEALSFAMNGGMYHANRDPVGLYVDEGTPTSRLVTTAGPGNFGLLPNGVLCIRAARADVIETLQFARTAPACRFATQSGPMLVIDGALHPRFIKDGTSRFIRNGVGSSVDGQTVVFAISNAPVNFHTFGRLFRDVLKTPNALYLDGKVSRLYAPALKRHDTGFWLGPIIGVVTRP